MASTTPGTNTYSDKNTNGTDPLADGTFTSIDVSGNATVGGNASISGSTTTGSLIVGTISSGSITSTGTVSGLNGTFGTTSAGTLSATSFTSPTASVTTLNGTDATLSGTLSTVNANVSGTLTAGTFAPSSLTTGTLGVTGNATVGGTLTTLDANVTGTLTAATFAPTTISTTDITASGFVSVGTTLTTSTIQTTASDVLNVQNSSAIVKASLDAAGVWNSVQSLSGSIVQFSWMWNGSAMVLTNQLYIGGTPAANSKLYIVGNSGGEIVRISARRTLGGGGALRFRLQVNGAAVTTADLVFGTTALTQSNAPTSTTTLAALDEFGYSAFSGTPGSPSMTLTVYVRLA